MYTVPCYWQFHNIYQDIFSRYFIDTDEIKLKNYWYTICFYYMYIYTTACRACHDGITVYTLYEL